MRRGQWVAIVAACVAWSGPAWGQGFIGPQDPASWVVTPITGGTSAVDLVASDANQLVLVYDVDLGGGGVSRRTALFESVAGSDGYFDVDWTYDYQHAWFQANAELTFYAYDTGGTRIDQVVFDSSTFGAGSTFGTLVSLPVAAGQAFGVEVGGSNFDSNSFLRGTVTLSNFSGIADCNGVLGGPDLWDNCGTCDADPTNDCMQDCNGVWGGTDVEDMCGTCDSDATNDCVQDCNGDWGGGATEDDCGTCDADPTNDCVQDCNGAWGGTDVEDECGTCDDDPTNDCVQDCLGVWGGTAERDNCGTCDDDPTNDCVEDCAGFWGGSSTEDMCGVCDYDPSNDCELDCNGDWGGTAAVDSCDVCSGGNTGIPVDECLYDAATGPVAAGKACGCDAGGGSAGGFLPGLLLLLGWRRRGREDA